MDNLKKSMGAKYVYVQDTFHKQIPQLTEVQINNKVLKCPFYGVIVRSNIDIECLKDTVFSKRLKNTQVVAYNLGDADKFRKKITKTLFEFTGETLNYKPFSEFIITIDPTGEYLLYNVKSEIEKLKAIPDMLSILKEIFNAEGSKRKKLIENLFNNDKILSSVVEWYLKKAISLNAEVSIPLCIPISGKTTLQYAIKTNRIATTIQQDNGWQKAVYFAIDFKSFKNERIINAILASIRALKPNMVVFKIFNHNFLKPEAGFERSLLQHFLNELYVYRIEEKALTFALNVDAILYHFLAQGLCGVIEPISGNYRPDIRTKRKNVDLEEDSYEYKNFGKYPDPIKLDEKDFNTLQTISKNNKQPYPCNCFECSKYQRLITNSYDYNRMRRRHRVHIRDTFVSELIETFINDNLRASMFDRFSEGAKLNVLKTYYS